MWYNLHDAQSRIDNSKISSSPLMKIRGDQVLIAYSGVVISAFGLSNSCNGRGTI